MVNLFNMLDVVVVIVRVLWAEGRIRFNEVGPHQNGLRKPDLMCGSWLVKRDWGARAFVWDLNLVA